MSADDWRERAACIGEDPEIFFPLSDVAAPGTEASLARAVCRRCAVLVGRRKAALNPVKSLYVQGYRLSIALGTHDCHFSMLTVLEHRKSQPTRHGRSSGGPDTSLSGKRPSV